MRIVHQSTRPSIHLGPAVDADAMSAPQDDIEFWLSDLPAAHPAGAEPAEPAGGADSPLAANGQATPPDTNGDAKPKKHKSAKKSKKSKKVSYNLYARYL